MTENVIKYLLEELKWLKELKVKLKMVLRNAPEGDMRVSYSHGKAQYYIRLNGEKGRGRYVKKKEQHMAKKYAQRDYDKMLERKVSSRIKTLERILKVCRQEDWDQIYDNLPSARKELVEPRIPTASDYAKRWEEVEYKGKSFEGDSIIIYTEKGQMVRSKSEKIIADKLYKMEIPYRYEHPLNLKGFGTIYPDFKVLNKRNRKEYYWEHFGKMDDPEYCEKAIKKINTYIKNGIYPGEQLIMTFETRECPLDVKVLENIIQRFLL